ncbi:MAG: cytochrome bc complex cytochrome b subunit [Halorientalis sp.]
MSDETDTDGSGASQGPAVRSSRVYRWLDHRLDLDRPFLGKAFPEDQFGSFLLGEVALFTFVILALSGTYLGLLYEPVAAESWQYKGQVSQYAGKTLPGAFASVLRITYDVRLGMYVRMVHHWAAYFFIAAMALHMFRVFFSGVYRNPREVNWLVGSTLLLLSLVEGFFGYALPYDNFSKTATSIGFEITATIPVLGQALENLVFGGNFPANAPSVLARMYFYHVFLLPLLLAGLIGVHLAILVHQKHTEQRSARDTDHAEDIGEDESVVVGQPLVPQQTAMSAVVFLFTAAVISFLAALFPVQRIALVGPASIFSTPPDVSPDWFFMWVFGALKLVPSGFGSLGRFFGGVVFPSLLVLAMYLWVFYDRSDDPIRFAANPLDRPLPTALGISAIALILMLSIAGMNSFVADIFGTTTEAVNPILLGLTIVVPLAEGLIVYGMLRRRVARQNPGHSATADD